jgi:hypothetical protein
MLFGAKGGCQQCTCGTCDACSRTCTNPHTGSAFATVYTRYFEGAESGRPTDGYLTATGDSDTSDPYDGMDGSGPWYQRVSGGFSLGGSSQGTRFPCSVRVSFWRNNYTLGPTVFPPPAATLTENTVEVIVTSGALIAPDGRVITPADGAVAISSVPLVSVSGDASSSDPRSGDGTVSYSAQCDNVETVFTIRATIRWNTKQRQHILYGKVRECYDTPDQDHPEITSCDTFCSGSPPPNTVYLTISSITSAAGWAPTTSSLSDAYLLNGTYVIDKWMRESGVCDQFLSRYASSCVGYGPLNTLSAAVNIGNGFGIYPNVVATTWVGGWKTLNGKCCVVVLKCQNGKHNICANTSGTGEVEIYELPYGTNAWRTSCSWTLSP